MQSEEKINLSKTHLEIAKERIAFAQQIMELGDYKTVANRSYYAVFAAMRAMLALDGFDSKILKLLTIAETTKNTLAMTVLHF